MGRKNFSHKYENFPTLDFHEGNMSSEKAKTMWISFIETNKRSRKRIVKVIHGHGSSGVGGVIRNRLRNDLKERQEKEVIRGFIPGEDFNSRSNTYKQFFNDFKELTFNSDFGNNNPGITIIIVY